MIGRLLSCHPYTAAPALVSARVSFIQILVRVVLGVMICGIRG